MGTKTNRHTRLVLCVLFFVMAGQAYGSILNVSVSPTNPTSQNVVTITVSGIWSTSCCPPYASTVTVSGNNIYFGLIVPEICIAMVCDPILWQQTQHVGLLSPGVYTIYTNLDGSYTQERQFTVSGPPGPAVRNVPSQYSTIQAAINASSNGDVIIVAPSTYTGSGNRDIDFLGKAITVRSTDPNDPCIIAATIIDCQGTNHRGFKFVSNEGRATTLEGLTITNANIAVMCEGGAGIYIADGASPTINNCVVANNHAQLVPESLCFCYGGGIFIGNGNPLITDCIITGNSVGNWGWGGGISIFSSTQATIHNCLISNNTALGYEDMGGGIYGSGLTVVNCTIVNNSTTNDGGGVYGFATIKDSIVWANMGINQIYGSANITYSDVQGGFVGTGNIDADPCFVTGPMGDYYLSQAAAGQATNSPCVDTGSDTAKNLNMNSLTTRTDGVPDTGVVNMGYHYPTSIVVLNSDLNGNFFVDFFDYALMSHNWQQSPDPCDPHSGDIIQDGIVDIYDLAKLCSDWLTCFVTFAVAPEPADHALSVSRYATLRWSPGENSISHDVYFGTDFNTVDTADTASSGVYMGNQDANFWDSNNYANELGRNTTYYWRIDEKCPACSTKGYVWSFTTRSVGEVNDANLVAWWKFDEANGTTAFDSAGSNNGNLINGPNWTTGTIDGALSFDGINDYVDVPDNAALRFTKSDSFSVCSWVNPVSTGEILCKMQSGSQHGLFTYEVQWNSTSQSFDFALCNSGNYYIVVVTPGGSAPPGSWYHVTCVYQNKNATIYLNGELKGSGYFNSNPSGAADKNLEIGVRAYGSVKENYINGTLDDVRMYNRALTADEVALLYQNGL